MEIKNLKKKIKNNQIIDNINYTFKENNIYSIVGRNGTGKSILLKLFSNYIVPNSGEIIIEKGKKVSCFLDENAFIGDDTAYENLYNIFKYIDKSKADRKSIEKVLIDLELIEYIDVKVEKFSKGMKQKLSLAKCLLEDYDILILDEPFNGVDIKSKEKIIDIIEKNKENKITIITTHRVDEIDKISDIILTLENGKFISESINNNKSNYKDSINYTEEVLEAEKIEKNILMKNKKRKLRNKIIIFSALILIIIYSVVNGINISITRKKAINEYNNKNYDKAYNIISKIKYYNYKDEDIMKIYNMNRLLYEYYSVEDYTYMSSNIKVKSEKEVLKEYMEYKYENISFTFNGNEVYTKLKDNIEDMDYTKLVEELYTFNTADENEILASEVNYFCNDLEVSAKDILSNQNIKCTIAKDKLAIDLDKKERLIEITIKEKLTNKNRIILFKVN